MCIEAWSCALTQSAPVTPWDKGIVTTKKGHFRMPGTVPKGGVFQLPHFPKLIFSLPSRTFPKAT